MSTEHPVRVLAPADAEVLAALRAEALRDTPVAFASSPEDDRMGDVDSVRTTLSDAGEHAVFGAFVDGALVGMVGIGRIQKLKARHLAHVWGMYVQPAHRGRGLAEGLLRAAIERARDWEGVARIGIGVSEASPGARRLYERVGFRLWGTEPDALRVDGVSYAEHFLSLELPRSQSDS